MCLIVLSLNPKSDYKLVLTSNRDEFYERPTESMHWWDSSPRVLAGKDKNFDGELIVCQSALKAVKGADAVIILTEWEEYKNLDWQSIYDLMRKPAWVFDSRVYLDGKKLSEIGFNVWKLGTS